MDDFEKIRWKTADNLTLDEAQVIVDNKDKLNDEEKAAFADLLQQAEPLPDNPLDEQINKAVDETVIDQNAQGAAAPIEPVVPQTPQPSAPTVDVIPKDQLDSYLEEKRKAWEAEGKTKAEQAKEAEKITTYFEQGYMPKDWNDFTVELVNKVSPIIEKQVLAKLEARNQEIATQQEKIKATEKEIFDRFEGEFATLAQNKLIPDPKVDPDGYKKAHEAILKIGGENGKTTITDAYKLYAVIPVEHGGGYVSGADTNKTVEQQKQAAGKIGSGRGAPAGSGTKGAPSWAAIHHKSMDQLIEERLHQQ